MGRAEVRTALRGCNSDAVRWRATNRGWAARREHAAQHIEAQRAPPQPPRAADPDARARARLGLSPQSTPPQPSVRQRSPAPCRSCGVGSLSNFPPSECLTRLVIVWRAVWWSARGHTIRRRETAPSRSAPASGSPARLIAQQPERPSSPEAAAALAARAGLAAALAAHGGGGGAGGAGEF